MKRLIILAAIAVFAFARKCKSVEEGNACGCKSVEEGNTCGSRAPPCNGSIYRSYDGTCNNLGNPSWGSSGSAYARFIDNSYSDGVHALPVSSNGKPLMNPRDISLKVFVDVVVEEPRWNLIFMQWGQVVAHDCSFTLFNLQTSPDRIVCCTNGEPIPPEPHPMCAAIPLTKDDPYNAPEGNTCMDFRRTASSKDTNCSAPGETAEPLSAVTAFHDLSIVYGFNAARAFEIRAFKKGKLKFVERNGQSWLPQHPNSTLSCDNTKSAQEPCYYSGENRVNQNPQLALLQTVLMRYHNLIAKQLCGVINPQWSDERCYQEARRINIAVAQQITYYEFLNILLGSNNMVEKGLAYPNTDGFVDDYDPNVNPQVLNEHATAAFRFYHTEIVGHLKKFSEDRHFTGQIRLSDWYNRPSIIEKGRNACELTRGLSTQPHNAVDRFFDSETTQYFLRGKNKLGLDLRAFDIQRSRDHGIGTYVKALKACGLSKPTCFKDLEKYIKPEYVKLLKRVYTCVEDVELTVGGALENLVDDTLAGPTFLCIMTKQFYRTRVGDRFFYENGNPKNGAFTAKQLNSIRKVTMSRVFCDTCKEITQMQPYAFVKISETNPLTDCNRLPQIDLSLWREYK